MKTKVLKVGLPMLVALVLGFAVYSWFGKASPAQQKLAESVKQGEYVFEQYLTADYGTAKDAILNYIRFLDQSGSESGNADRNPYAVDAMCWYVRLANLEESNNRGGQEEYIQEACRRCEKLKWTDCTREKLRADVDRMDAIALAQLKKK